MAVTPNYGLFVYGAEDTSVRFLDFRVNIAGTQSTSNFYVIDTKMKEMSDKIQILENSPSAYSINATYSSENYYIASSLDFPGYEANQLISLSLDRNNIGTVTININSSSTVSVMKYNNSGELVNMDDNDFTINNPILCIYDGTRFVAIGVKNANNINISGNNGEIVVVSPENKLASSGKKIGEPNGVASLDSSGNVQQPANSTVNSLTISLNGNAQTPFNGGNPVSFNITPEAISAATSEQGQKADDLVSGDVPAGKATILANPRKIGNAEFDGSKDISGSEIGIPNPNLLDNTNFEINQRGNESYTDGGFITYGGPDRWKQFQSTFVVTTKLLSKNSAGGSGQIFQLVPLSEKGLASGDTVTASLYVDGVLYSGSGEVKTSYPDYSLLIDEDDFSVLLGSQDSLTDVVALTIQCKKEYPETIKIEKTKLEKGDVATPWQPKGYGAELAECIRFFRQIRVDWQTYSGAGYNARVPVALVPPMRTAPTASDASRYVFNCTLYGLEFGAAQGGAIALSVTGAGATAYSSLLSLSADL